MVGAEREAEAGGPAPEAASRVGSAELRPSAESPQWGGVSSPLAALESEETREPLVCFLLPKFSFTRRPKNTLSTSSP